MEARGFEGAAEAEAEVEVEEEVEEGAETTVIAGDWREEDRRPLHLLAMLVDHTDLDTVDTAGDLDTEGDTGVEAPAPGKLNQTASTNKQHTERIT